jgi:predicted DsbA family dithiol-disulfide isomerase
MSEVARTVVEFYHSVICPRCQVSGIALRRVLDRHPGIEVRKVEFLTNAARAREAGVTSIPTLVSGGRSLTGVILTPAKIERFLESLASGPIPDRG